MAKISRQPAARLRRIKLFLCDVDGVLTDGSIFIGGEREFKRFNIRDGLGMVLARRAGLKVGWVSARPSLATKMRAEELKIDFLVQQGDNTSKTGAIEQLLAQEKLDWATFVLSEMTSLTWAADARGVGGGGGRRAARGQSGGALRDQSRRRARRGARGGGNDFEGAGKMAAICETLRGMKPGVKKYFFAAAALAFLLAAPGARAQVLPLGNATNFSTVTYFEPPHEQQVKMRLSGAEASPLPGTLFDLKKMKVEKFGSDGKPEAVVLAPQCVYAPLDGVASSPGHLELKSGDGKIRTEGDGFLWQQNEQSLVISNHVRTVIELPSAKPDKP